MSGPFLCSIFMDLVGSNGFFIFLFFFHTIIGIFGIHRMRVRQTVDNPDSQFVAMPQTITPAGIALNPQTEPIQEPLPAIEEISITDAITTSKSSEKFESFTETSDENKN